jgi:DNA-directed RNA polymerase specialized sigma subunit
MSGQVYKVAEKLNISKNKIIFTNGKYKWEAIKRLDIGTHYDNNQQEIDLINSNTDAKGVKF